jgi:hypothetical protein
MSDDMFGDSTCYCVTSPCTCGASVTENSETTESPKIDNVVPIKPEVQITESKPQTQSFNPLWIGAGIIALMILTK